MRIGELSVRTGATERMLRYYEQNGLLSPARTSSGYREYAETDIQRVHHIRCMLASALPTHVVRRAVTYLLDGAPSVPGSLEERTTLAKALSEELATLDDRIANLQRSRESLARFVGDITSDAVGPDRPQTVNSTDYGPAVAAGVPVRRGRRAA